MVREREEGDFFKERVNIFNLISYFRCEINFWVHNFFFYKEIKINHLK